MAEATGKSSTAFEDLMMVVFAMLLVAGAVRQVPQILQNKLGVDIGAPYLVASAAIGADTPLGTAVATVNGTPFYATPGTTDTSGGEFGPGTSLVLRQGPKTMIGGVRWWYVEDAATGNAGWVPESALVRDGVGGVGPATALGTKVRTLLTTDIWDAAGGTDKVGTAAKGTAGTLTNGPTETGGVRWWYFERDGSGASGWVPESALLLSSGKDWRAGSAVRATQDADLFEHAGGGQALGSVRNGDELRIVGGPSLSGGAYWWLVQTQDGTQGWMPESGLADGGIKGWAKGALAVLLVVAATFTVLLLVGILYATIRTNQVRAREARRIREAIPKTMQPKRNERWERVVTHVSSDNPNDWRLAVIEADVMLDELVTRMGFLGMTLGDKLKQATKGDFKTIDAAWEAHRVRNQVAHAGSDFILTQREAKRIIGLYESVFAEFRYI